MFGGIMLAVAMHAPLDTSQLSPETQSASLEQAT